jgi:O-antigen/teichoic acid export membrane protein
MKKTLGKLKGFAFFDSFKHISTYFIAQLLGQGLGVISMPVFTHYMTKAEYGLANVYQSYALTFSIVLALNLNGAVNRYFFEPNNDMKGFMGTSILSALGMFSLFGLFFYLFRDTIASTLNLPVETVGWMLFYGALLIVWRIYETYYIAMKASTEYAVTMVIFQYMKFGFAWLLLYLAVDSTYMSKAYGEIIAGLLIVIFVLWRMRNTIRLRFVWEHFVYIFKFSVPLIPYVLSSFILNYFDQWYINAALSSDDAGLYSFAYKIAMFNAGFVVVVQNATNPDFYKWMNESAVEQIHKQAVSILKILALATLTICIFAKEAGLLLISRDEYIPALPLVSTITFGLFFFGVAQLNVRYIYFLKRNAWLSATMIGISLLNVLLNYLAMGYFKLGYQAAAYTTLISYVVLCIVMVYITEYRFKMPHLPWKRLLSIIMVTFVAYALGTLVDHYAELGIGLSLALKSVIWLLGFLYLYLGQLKYSFSIN